MLTHSATVSSFLQLFFKPEIQQPPPLAKSHSGDLAGGGGG